MEGLQNKKVNLLIPAIVSLNQKTISYHLKIVGDGPEKQHLQSLVKKFKADRYIEFVAATYDEREIGELFLEADLLVSPGNVGLNAVHALSYGTPVITHTKILTTKCRSMRLLLIISMAVFI